MCFGSVVNPEDVKEPSEHRSFCHHLSCAAVRALGKHRPSAAMASWMGGQWPLSKQGFVARLGGWRWAGAVLLVGLSNLFVNKTGDGAKHD